MSVYNVGEFVRYRSAADSSSPKSKDGGIYEVVYVHSNDMCVISSYGTHELHVAESSDLALTHPPKHNFAKEFFSGIPYDHTAQSNLFLYAPTVSGAPVKMTIKSIESDTAKSFYFYPSIGREIAKALSGSALYQSAYYG
jgi:hypothetical protein